MSNLATMKIGLFLALFGDRSLEEALDKAKAAGCEAVEIGAGNYPGSGHLDVDSLLSDTSKRNSLLKAVESRGLMISALSCHGNPLHPNREIAEEHNQNFVKAVELAVALGVPVVNGFSGCPGDGPNASQPNWVTCAWPDEFRDILEWQWNESVLPYWREQSKLLAKHKIRFAIEMHPGFVVYNNETLLRLRENTNEFIGANFDPSHLWWQGIDPLVAVKQLGHQGALFHVHAKDLRIDPQNSSTNGNLDTKSYGDVSNRSWVFRTVGYGHTIGWWRDFVSCLRMSGYDYILSIEHEDGLMSTDEGLRRATETLRSCVIREPAGPMFWAKD